MMNFTYLNPNHVLPFTHLPVDPRKYADLRKCCGPYQFRVDADNEYRSAYLDSDFFPGLRWEYADEVASSIHHTGWFCDEYEDDKIRGIVLRLPKGRGFLAGWTMGEKMATQIDVSWVHDDEIEAAHAADGMAEFAAERQREYLESIEDLLEDAA
jgi:hypothetical protein